MGNAFALLQIKTILAVLLHRYDFELVGDTIETDFQGLMLGPQATDSSPLPPSPTGTPRHSAQRVIKGRLKVGR